MLHHSSQIGGYFGKRIVISIAKMSEILFILVRGRFRHGFVQLRWKQIDRYIFSGQCNKWALQDRCCDICGVLEVANDTSVRKEYINTGTTP